MTPEQATIFAAVVAVVGTVLGALIGAVIAGVVAVRVTRFSNEHAERLARDERLHQDRSRKHAAGMESAKATLLHLNHIRAVFDRSERDPRLMNEVPEQEWYEQPYRDAVLMAVDIDNDDVAKTLSDIAEAYWAAWLATELGEWTPGALNLNLYTLARATVRAYTQDHPLPDRSELDRVQRAIDTRWEERQDDERRAREQQRQERMGQLSDMGTKAPSSAIAPPSAKA